jgi:Protein of unknown function (DUF3592)
MVGSALFGLLFVVVGGFGVVAGVQSLRETRGILARAERVPGILVRIQAEHFDGHVYQYPVLWFRTVDGREIETTSDVTGTPEYLFRMRGHQVPVVYDRDAPAKARIDDAHGRGRPHAVLFITLGAIFALGGIAYLVAKIG